MLDLGAGSDRSAAIVHALAPTTADRADSAVALNAGAAADGAARAARAPGAQRRPRISLYRPASP